MTEEQERAAFEAEMRQRGWGGYELDWDVELQEYDCHDTRLAWSVWQARAVLSPSTPDPLPQEIDNAIRLSEKEG